MNLYFFSFETKDIIYNETLNIYSRQYLIESKRQHCPKIIRNGKKSTISSIYKYGYGNLDVRDVVFLGELL